MPHACTNCGRTFPDGSKEMLSGCPDCGGNKFRYHPDGVAEDGPSDRAPPDPDEEGLPGRDQGVVDRATTTVREWVGTRSGPSGADGTPDPARPREPTGSEAPAGPTSGSGGGDAASGPSAETTASDTTSGPSAEATTTDTPDDPAPDADAAEAPTEPDDAPEDTAQADARTSVADPAEIPDTPVDGDAPDLGPAEERAAAVAGAPGERGDGEASAQAAAEPADPTATPSASNLAQLREELNEQFESIKIVEPGEYELNLMGLYDREEYIISLMEDGRYAIEVPETWRDAEDLPDE